MIRSDDPEIEGYEFRYKVIEVIGVMPEVEMPDGHMLAETVFKLMRRGRGWPVVIQTGKLLWLTDAGRQAEVDRLDAPSAPR